MSKYCLFLIVIYYLTGGNNSMSRFFKFGKLHVTKGNVKELLEGKETLVKGIKNKEKKPYNAVVKIGEKGYIDFISFSK